MLNAVTYSSTAAQVLRRTVAVIEKIFGLAGSEEVCSELGPVETDRQGIAHVGHQREVEQLRVVELVVKPSGVRSVVLLHHAGERPPLCGMIARGFPPIGIPGSLTRLLACRERPDRSDDQTCEWRDDEEKLDQPEQQSHLTRMPPRSTLDSTPPSCPTESSSMKFVLVAYGSRGDVEPCAVVGRELLRRGHDVHLAVPPNMLTLVESVGLTAVGYGPDSHAQLDSAADYFVGQMKNPYSGLPEMVERVTQVWTDKGTVLAELADGSDLLLTGMNEQRLAANVAEYRGIPLVTLHPFPERIQPSGLLKSQLEKLSENPLRRLLGLPEAAESTAASLEIQAYDERCLPGEPAQWAEPGKPFVGALTLESPTDTDDEVLVVDSRGNPTDLFRPGQHSDFASRRHRRDDHCGLRAVRRAVVGLRRAQRFVRIRSFRPRETRQRGE